MQVPRHWREIPQRYRLEAARCVKCGNISFPPRLVCPECGARDFATVKLSGKGKLVTYTIIEVAPAGFTDQVPYAVAIVDLEEGPRIMGMVTDCDPGALHAGDPLVTQFCRIREEGQTGMIMYGYKFVPDLGL